MMMLYGAICIIAMILPGLSGSFLLLIFGQYNKIWTMVGNIARFQFNCDEILMLLYLVIGCAAGLAYFFFTRGSVFAAFFFAYLTYQNYAILQNATRR
jgi:uncharacterized membrane protein